MIRSSFPVLNTLLGVTAKKATYTPLQGTREPFQRTLHGRRRCASLHDGLTVLPLLFEGVSAALLAEEKRGKET